MKYADGPDIEPGDLIQIASNYRGKVIASMDTGRYLPGEEGWTYLRKASWSTQISVAFGRKRTFETW